LKTVAELAKELNVSVQSVYRALNKVKQNEKKRLTEKKSGITYITEDGEAFVIESLPGVKHRREEPFNDVKQELNTAKQAEQSEILYLREQNKALQEELKTEREHSRSQADRLATLAEQLADLNKNQQVLLGLEQGRNSPLLVVAEDSTSNEEKGENKEKRGFFSLFKKRGK